MAVVDDGVKDAVGRDIVRGNRRSDRINEEGHIVVGNRNAHDPAPAGIGAGFRDDSRSLGMFECL